MLNNKYSFWFALLRFGWVARARGFNSIALVCQTALETALKRNNLPDMTPLVISSNYFSSLFLLQAEAQYNPVLKTARVYLFQTNCYCCFGKHNEDNFHFQNNIGRISIISMRYKKNNYSLKTRQAEMSHRLVEEDQHGGIVPPECKQ